MNHKALPYSKRLFLSNGVEKNNKGVFFSFQSLQIQDLQHEMILLQRDVRNMRQVLTDKQILSNEHEAQAANLLGLEPSLTKFRPRSEDGIIPWDFIQRSMYSAGNLNPRRRIDSAYREGIEDVIREVSFIMISKVSKVYFHPLGYGNDKPIFSSTRPDNRISGLALWILQIRSATWCRLHFRPPAQV